MLFLGGNKNTAGPGSSFQRLFDVAERWASDGSGVSSWSSVKSLPAVQTQPTGFGRTGLCSAADTSGALIYAVGGGTADLEGQNRLDVNVLHSYAVQTDVWVPRKSMPSAQTGAACGITSANSFVVAGGVGSSVRLNLAHKYQVADDTWTTVHALPGTRGFPSGAAVGEDLWAIGGDTGPPTATAVMSSAHRYNQATDRWTTSRPMPSGRRRAAAVAHGTLIFVLGGQNAAPTPVEVSTAEAFDTKSETWTTVLAMPTDLGLLAAGRYTASGFYSLVVTGGQNNTASEAAQRTTHTVRLPEYARRCADLAQHSCLHGGLGSAVEGGTLYGRTAVATPPHRSLPCGYPRGRMFSYCLLDLSLAARRPRRALLPLGPPRSLRHKLPHELRRYCPRSCRRPLRRDCRRRSRPPLHRMRRRARRASRPPSYRRRFRRLPRTLRLTCPRLPPQLRLRWSPLAARRG